MLESTGAMNLATSPHADEERSGLTESSLPPSVEDERSVSPTKAAQCPDPEAKAATDNLSTMSSSATLQEFPTLLRKQSASLVRASIPPPINTANTSSPLKHTILPSPAPPVGISDTPPDNTGQPGTFHVGVASDRNRRCRRTMEDSHSFFYNFANVPGQGFFTIFDGHAGKQAAEWCGLHFHEVFLELLQKHSATGSPPSSQASPSAVPHPTPSQASPSPSSVAAAAVDPLAKPSDVTAGLSIPELLHRTFVESDRRISAELDSQSGCTAVAAFLQVNNNAKSMLTTANTDDVAALDIIPRWTLYLGNAGDARAVLARDGRAVRLTYDHKGDDPNEVRRVMEAGGFVLNNRVNGVLAVTRALGDTSMKEVVVGHPYTTETTLTTGADYLILACDGLWDVCSDQKAVDLIRSIDDPQQASETLTKYALDNFSRDNITVMVVRLYH
ncbi:phosphatase 2C [Dimargaris xerosporica]|nr:phosphatase 2C [Dimargaris xerosporica]